MLLYPVLFFFYNLRAVFVRVVSVFKKAMFLDVSRRYYPVFFKQNKQLQFCNKKLEIDAFLVPMHVHYHAYLISCTSKATANQVH